MDFMVLGHIKLRVYRAYYTWTLPCSRVEACRVYALGQKGEHVTKGFGVPKSPGPPKHPLIEPFMGLNNGSLGYIRG